MIDLLRCWDVKLTICLVCCGVMPRLYDTQETLPDYSTRLQSLSYTYRAINNKPPPPKNLGGQIQIFLRILKTSEIFQKFFEKNKNRDDPARRRRKNFRVFLRQKREKRSKNGVLEVQNLVGNFEKNKSRIQIPKIFLKNKNL